LKVQGTRLFQKLRTARPTTWHHFLEDLNHLCESSFLAYCKQLALLAMKKEMQNEVETIKKQDLNKTAYIICVRISHSLRHTFLCSRIKVYIVIKSVQLEN